MMYDDHILQAAKKHGERILDSRYSKYRIATLCKVEVDEAPQVRACARELRQKGEVPAAACTKNVWLTNVGTIATFIRSARMVVELPLDVHEGILEAYSDFDGNPATAAEIEQQFGLSKKLVAGYLRVHNMTHSDVPVSVHKITSNTQSELVEELVAKARNATRASFATEITKSVKQDAKRWRELEKNVELLTARVDGVETKFDPSPDNSDGFLAVISPTDLHYGKYGAEGTVAEEYNRELASERLLSSTDRILTRTLKNGFPERILLVMGSDWFHIDTPGGTTTKGTPQDCDGTWEDIYVGGCELSIQMIEMVREVAPVDIIVMPGNHDYTDSISHQLFLWAWYRDCEDVNVSRNIGHREYAVYGNTLLGFTHGDEVKKDGLLRVMSHEARHQWSTCEHKIWFTGNYHTEKAEDLGGVLWYQMPSLSGTDRWHHKNGYVGADKAVMCFMIDKEEGLVGTNRVVCDSPTSKVMDLVLG